MGTVGKYTVIGPLGSGGMSEIHLARAPDGTLVVLKRQLMPEDDPYLIDEGNLGLRLSHPGLVETLELFDDDERPVLALTYVPGVSLASLLATGPLPTASVCDIGAQIAEALDALHRATDVRGNPLNIIHRDVTPSNILIGFDGHARLIDLGIARFVNSMAPRTKVGDVRGTLHYLAPEVVQGGLHSQASDLWSLGVSLFEAAVGRVAIERDDLENVLDAITNQRVLALREGEQLDIRVRHALAQLVNPEARCRPAFAGDAAAILGIHAAEHPDAKQETVNRVAILLGKPAQTHLAAGADDAAKTAVLSQAELLFGGTLDGSQDGVNPIKGVTREDLDRPVAGPGAASLDLSDETVPSDGSQSPVDNPAEAYPEFEIDDDKTAALPSPFVPEPISALDGAPPSLAPAAAAANPFALPPTLPVDHPMTDPARQQSDSQSAPLPVSALHEGLVPEPPALSEEVLQSLARAEDALPDRMPHVSAEGEPTHAAHPMVMQDLAKKSVQVRSLEGPIEDDLPSIVGQLEPVLPPTPAAPNPSVPNAPSAGPSLAAAESQQEAPLGDFPVDDRTVPLAESPLHEGWDPLAHGFGDGGARQSAQPATDPEPQAALVPPAAAPLVASPPEPVHSASVPPAVDATPPSAVDATLPPTATPSAVTPQTVAQSPAPSVDAPVAPHDPFAGTGANAVLDPFSRNVPAAPAGTPVGSEVAEVSATPTRQLPWAAIGAALGVAVFAFVVGYVLAQLSG